MLQHISWTQFLSYSAATALLWYAAILSIYYRQELKRLFSRKPPVFSYQEEPQDPQDDLLGEIQQEEGYAEGKSMEEILGQNLPGAKSRSVMLLLLLGSVSLYAQDGNAGIAEATNKVKGYFDTGCDLMYAIGAVVGLIGAVKVYSKWNAGEPDTGKVATSWFGSCIFLVVVATVLKSFFGI